MMRASSLLHSIAPSRCLILAVVLAALLAVFLVDGGAPPDQASHTHATPANVVATGENGAGTVTWSSVRGAGNKRHNFQYKEQFSADSTATTQDSIVSTNCTVLGLTNGSFCVFRVNLYDINSGHTASACGGWVTAISRAAPTTQVSNFAQARTDITFSNSTSYGSQGSTTGTNSAGYTLSGIKVDVGDSTEPKYSVEGLSPGQVHQVLVLAHNSYSMGSWAMGSGVPLHASYTLSQTSPPERVREGYPVSIAATVKYGGRVPPIQENLDILLSTQLDTAEAVDVGTLERISIGKCTDKGSAIQTHRDGAGDDGTFAVLIPWIPKSDLARTGHPAIAA